LYNVLDDIDKKNAMVLMGEFNAKVGCNKEEVEHIVGTHGIRNRNENGELIIELCGRYNFKIGGTLFPHKLCHKATWVSPNSNMQNRIDHIRITAKWKNMLLDVRNKRGADVGSDHHLLVATLKINMKRVIKRNIIISTRRMFNIGKLQDKDVKETCTNHK
jgi:endonuclease/exonuclease/phosphatase family metal-dependent hydrolase